MVIVRQAAQDEPNNNEAPSYGKELPDQFQRISDLLEKNIDFLGDVRELIRERAVLEKEYATKLQALTRKAAEKRNVRGVVASRVLGDDPIKAWDDSTLRQRYKRSRQSCVC
ncbi:hypothetical protein FRC03_006171 [Tulasnella sp. 419]|nr:hypothetical protein FRC03_006171 [Tulasnella sp. 419]